MKFPDARGYFGIFGGRFVPETLMAALTGLDATYRAVKNNRQFKAELAYYLREYAGRPTPLSLTDKFQLGPRP